MIFSVLIACVRLIRVGITTEVWEAAKTDDPTRYVLKVLKRHKRTKKYRLLEE